MESLEIVLIEFDGEDTNIFAPDGGVAVIRHNGEHMVTDYYHDRVESIDQEDIWEKLAEGKMSCLDWSNDQSLTSEQIRDAVSWLGFDPQKVFYRLVD